MTLDDDRGAARLDPPDAGALPPDNLPDDPPTRLLFAMNAPPVPVVVKKRRAALDRPEAAGDAAAHGPAPAARPPRVHQVRAVDGDTPSQAVEAPAEAGRAGESGAAGGSGGVAAGDEAAPTPLRRRRARRDPTHAPGAVTRTVFEVPPRADDTHAEEAALPPFIVPTEVGYEQVMAALKEVRGTVETALRSPGFEARRGPRPRR